MAWLTVAVAARVDPKNSRRVIVDMRDSGEVENIIQDTTWGLIQFPGTDSTQRSGGVQHAWGDRLLAGVKDRFQLGGNGNVTVHLPKRDKRHAIVEGGMDGMGQGDHLVGEIPMQPHFG
jgi:hypothetical protein